ncbi:hypothetical protein RHMOL_Rhmol13G0225700 [Rhododendron molle]|uniref:Uncharacterized protein n=2 Tax=Rhododendron molle TaxID=49168 RepID=A0ACC0L9C5_RHOML|nr:hypothetical protein RHMOL_Rhmol13G0225700 [Rhododendron molle]KAI8525378.1 hypothetical protein RHMOL_Rhmol13G0225700 [Rhododendron molle]
MGWLTKIMKGSSHKISEGQYQAKYGDERIWVGPSTTDAWSDFETEDVDHAIALSLAEEDQKGKKVIVTNRRKELERSLKHEIEPDMRRSNHKRPSSPRLDGNTLHRRVSLQECSNITCMNYTRWVYASVFTLYLVNFGWEKPASGMTELISSVKGEETIWFRRMSFSGSLPLLLGFSFMFFFLALAERPVPRL